jgi:hypothetical protein
MTQAFYTKSILPEHIKYLKQFEHRCRHKMILQEDNDPSHGHRSANNAPTKLRKASQIEILAHPAQSPDLNPIEAIWMIIRKRLHGGRWQTLAEFKAAIKREWRRITPSQIRSRISTIPQRCKHINNTKG